MADIPVYESTAETVVVVTANGQATFAFDFLILFPEQMTVLHGRGDVETVLTYPADFSVSGLDEPNGGTVTLNVATLVNDVITMRRVTPIERLNDWQNEGDYKAALVNREQDTMFMIMQELARDTGEASAEVALMDGRITAETQARASADAALSGRIDKEIVDRSAAISNEAYLRAAGDKSVASLIGQAGPIETQVYDTQTAASLSTVKPTIQTVRTGGFFAAGDGGGALYKRSLVEPDHDGKFQSADGAWWEIADIAISPEMFGAKGDGIVDDGNAVYAALFMASLTGVKFQAVKTSTYRIDRSISISRTANSPDLLIDWNGAHIYSDGLGSISINGPNTPYLTTSLTVDPVKGDPKVTLADVTGIEKGDVVRVQTPVIISSGIPVTHYYLVEEVDGNDVYIEGVVLTDINPQQVIDDGFSGAIVVDCYKLAGRCEMRNGHFSINDPAGQRTTTQISHHYRVVVDNIEYRGHTRNQLALFNNGHTLTTRMKFHDFGYVDKDRGYSSQPTDPSGQGYGYGVIHAHNCFSVVRDVVGGRGWHVTDVSRGQMHILFDTVVALRNSYGFAHHPGCWETTYINCVAYGNSVAQVGNAVFLTMKGCRFYDFWFNAIVYYRDAVSVIIEDCYFYGVVTTSTVTTAFAQTSGTAKKWASFNSVNHETYRIAKNNTVIHSGQAALTGSFVDNFILDNNYFELSSGIAVGGSSAKRVSVRNNTTKRQGEKNSAQSGSSISFTYGNTTDVVISDNDIGMHPGQSSFRYAFYLPRNIVSTLVFIKNNITNCGGLIGLAAGTGTTDVAILEGNTAYKGPIARQTDIKVKYAFNNVGTGSTLGADVTTDVGYQQVTGL